MSKNIGFIFLIAVAIAILFTIALQPTFVERQKYSDNFTGDCRVHYQTSTRINSLGFRKTVGGPYTLIILSSAGLKDKNLTNIEISSLDENSNILKVYNQNSISQIDGGYTLRDINLPKHSILVRVFFENRICESKAIFTQEKFFTLRRFSA